MEHIKFLMDEKRRLQDNMDGIYDIINDLENNIEDYQLEAEAVDTTIKYLDKLINDEKNKQNIGPKVEYKTYYEPGKNLSRLQDKLSEAEIRFDSGIDSIEFDTVKEAEEFRDQVYAYILKNGVLSIHNFKLMIGLDSNLVECEYGWKNFDNIFITLKNDPSYLIKRGKKRFKIVMPAFEKLVDDFNKINYLDDGWYSVNVGESYLGSLGRIEELKRLFKVNGSLSLWEFKRVVDIETTDWLEHRYGWKNIDRMFVSANTTIKVDGIRKTEYFINMPPIGWLD